jgi:hypothetical protein
LTTKDTETLLSFYRNGSQNAALSKASKRLCNLSGAPGIPHRCPANAKTGQAYRVGDLELASRLSFFLWSNIPDDELINLAGQGELKDPRVLEQQVRRMLADPRSQELVKNFAGQWLGLRTLQSQTPEGTVYPDFDDNLRQAMRTETQMFFESIMREDRSSSICSPPTTRSSMSASRLITEYFTDHSSGA